MDTDDTTIRLAVALAAGLVLGLERGWSHSEPEFEAPGIRTFTLTALLGGVLQSLSTPFLAIAGLVGVAALAHAGYRETSSRSTDFGYTTEIALLLSYACGAAAGMGYLFVAIAVATVGALTLGLKLALHHFLRRFQREEMLSTLQLLVVAVVLLPLTPTEDVWLDGLNLRQITWFVLLILGVSYVGYVSTHLLGNRRGIAVTSLLGGLTSSTATTVSLSQLARDRRSSRALLAAGVLAACAMMPLRLLLLTTVINQALVTKLAPMLGAMALTLLGAAILVGKRTETTSTDQVPVSNPLDLKSAASFAVFLAVLFVSIPWLEAQFGHLGIYFAAGLSGLTDVDAIGLTLARKSLDGIDSGIAATGIAVAAVTNTAVKAAIASWRSNGALNRSAGLPLLCSAVLGLLVGTFT